MQSLSKEELVYSTLAGLANRIGPNGKLPTIRELCSKLSVSRSTLDRVLRQLERDRILVCRHGSGIYVSPFSNQRRIAMIFGGNIHDALRYSQFWSLIHGAVLRLAEHNGDELRTYYGCPTHHGDDIEPSAFSLTEDLEARRITGLLTAGLGSDMDFKWLKSWNVPVISLGITDGRADADVGFDQEAGLLAAFEELARIGCRKVALVWSGSDKDSFIHEKDATTLMYKAALAKAGLPYYAELRWPSNLIPPGRNCESNEDAGGLLMHELWSKDKGGAGPDAICFMEDTMAHGGLIALMEKKVDIGRDVNIVVMTSKGSSLLRPFWPRIFRIEVDLEEAVSLMFAALGRFLQGNRPPERTSKVTPALLPPTRNS